MRGDAEVIKVLSAVLTAELTAINQYFIHAKMSENWGYSKIAENKRSEAIGEMKHADRVIERILFLEGTPNMQGLNPVRIGENIPEQHAVDLELEIDAVERLNEGIALCREKADNGTRELLEEILHEEEEGIDYLEAQLGIIEEIGKERYLSEQM
jgi:bacterioferritin